MIVSSETLVNAPPAQAWAVIADQFGDISHWAASVVRSDFRAQNQGTLLGGTRTCSIPGFGEISEYVDTYEPEKMRYGYRIDEGMPFFVKKATNRWFVRKVSANQAQVGVVFDLKLSPVIGTLMGPLLKMQLKKGQPKMLEELAYYIETGRPHQRTQDRFEQQAIAS